MKSRTASVLPHVGNVVQLNAAMLVSGAEAARSITRLESADCDGGVQHTSRETVDTIIREPMKPPMKCQTRVGPARLVQWHLPALSRPAGRLRGNGPIDRYVVSSVRHAGVSIFL